MSNPTKGPWVVREFTNGRCGIISDSGRAIASTATHPGENGPGYWSKVVPEDRANAQLIAAAPDLLAACEYFAFAADAWANVVHYMNAKGGSAPAAIALAFETAREALRKARAVPR